MVDPFVVASLSETFGRFSDGPRERLEGEGCEVRLNPLHRPPRPQEALELAGDADAIILGNTTMDESLISRLPRLRLVVRHGAGLDGIDLDACAERGIVVANTPGANREDTADLTFGLILGLTHLIHPSVELVRSGGWDKLPGRSLHGKTLGIVGVGAIGTAVARRAMGFGLDILGNDIVEREEPTRHGLLYVGLNELLSQADVVTLHVPLTSATRNLIGARELRCMGEGAYLVNTARAGIVRHGALRRALVDGWLGGYGTDVYEREPPPADDLWRLPNVLTTPHMGSATLETNLSMGMMAADNIIAFKDGHEPPFRVTAADRVRFS